MKNIILLLFIFCGVISANAQADSSTTHVDSCSCGEVPLILDFVEEMPAPPTGWDKWDQYVKSQIRLPDSILKKGTGTVYIALTVDVTGKVCTTFVRKGFKAVPEFDSEALRIVQESGTWKPGRMNGKPVCVRMNIGIKIPAE